MDEADVEAFDKFVEKHWGKNLETISVSANVSDDEPKPKRRGRKPKEV